MYHFMAGLFMTLFVPPLSKVKTRFTVPLRILLLFKIYSPTAVESLESEEEGVSEPESEEAGAVTGVAVVKTRRLGKVGLGVVNPSFSAVTRGPTISPRKLPNAATHGSAKFKKTGWIMVLLNKAGYTATPVACEWAGAVFEVT